MTPAIDLLNKHKVAHKVHQYEHDPSSESYGLEAATKLGVPAERVFKTLVTSAADKSLVVGVLPVSTMLSLKSIAKAAGVKKLAMAQAADVERSTGYVLGGVSPLGQKKRLRTVIDSSAAQHPTIFISAGRRGLEIELAPEDLRTLVSAVYAAIAAV